MPLVNILLALIAIIGVGAIFITILNSLTAPAVFKKVAQIAVGIVFLSLLVIVLASALFGGPGIAITIHGVIAFAISAIIIAFVLWLADRYIPILFAAWGFGGLSEVALVIFGVIAVIALLYAVDAALLGGYITHAARTY